MWGVTGNIGTGTGTGTGTRTTMISGVGAFSGIGEGGIGNGVVGIGGSAEVLSKQGLSVPAFGVCNGLLCKNNCGWTA